MELEDFIENKALLKACKTSFGGGEYWDAVFQAMRYLEEKIRGKCDFFQRDIGVDLVNKAFNTDNGKLLIPCCKTLSEEKGFHLIALGVMQFHRNAKGHRKGEIDKNSALKIIGYVDYLISIIDTSLKREGVLKNL